MIKSSYWLWHTQTGLPVMGNYYEERMNKDRGRSAGKLEELRAVRCSSAGFPREGGNFWLFFKN